MDKVKIVNYCDKVIEWSFYGIISAAAFSISIVEILSAAMIGVWLIKISLTRDISFLKEKTVWVLIMFFIWVLLSCFNSSYASESFRGVFSKVGKCALLFIVTATGMRNYEAAARRFFYVILAGVIIICINGLVQYFTGYDIIRHRALISKDYMNRISSSFIHPNNFGVYLVVVLPVLISFVITVKKNFANRAASFFAVILAGICLFLTRSRGAWMSFVAALIALGLLKSKKVLGVFLVFLLITFVLLPSNTKERIINLADLESGTSWERVMLWRGTIDMIKAHPVLGFGINTFSRNFPDYKPKEYPDLRYTHNCYLQLASEVGIPGLLFFLLFIALVLRKSIMNITVMPEGEEKALLTGIFAGLTGFYLNSMVDTHLFSVDLAVFSYVLLGFLLGVSEYASKTGK